MSGDAQVRKRKAKNKKNVKGDDHSEDVSGGSTGSDENIHVYKEASTGGSICAKLMFFTLLGGLLVMIGLVAINYQGDFQADIARAESRFKGYFEGFLDESTGHDEHDEPMSAEDEDEGIGHSEEEDEVSHEEGDDEHGEEGDDHEQEEHEDETEEEPAASESREDDEGVGDGSEEEEERESESAGDDDDDDEDVSAEYQADEDASTGDDEAAEEEEGSVEEDSREIVGTGDSTEDGEDEDNTEESREDIEAQESDEDVGAGDSAEESREDMETGDSAEEVVESQEQDEEEDQVEDLRSSVDDNLDEEDTSKPTSAEVEDEEEAASSSLGVGLKLLGAVFVVVTCSAVIKRWTSSSTNEGDEGASDEVPTPTVQASTVSAAPPTKTVSEPIIVRKVIPPPPQAPPKPVWPVDDDEEEEDEEEEEEEDVPKQSSQQQEQEREGDDDDAEESEDESEEDEDADDDDEEAEEEEESEEEDEPEPHPPMSARKPAEHQPWTRSKAAASSQEETNAPVPPARRGRHSGAQSAEDYDDDDPIMQQLNRAEEELDQSSPSALALFSDVLSRNPLNHRALLGKAKALEIMAESQRSNNLLEQSIVTYQQLVDLGSSVPDDIFREAAQRCINKMRFRGFYLKAVPIHQQLAARFPEESNHPNQLVVTYMTAGRNKEAQEVLENILKKWPDNGFAKVHYGFILKAVLNRLEEGVKYLYEGINSRETGTQDGRFYFQLGDALARLGRQPEAEKVYEDGVQNGLFLSKYQRSLYNVNHLTGRPWWTLQQTTYESNFRIFEQRWRDIRDEALALMNSNQSFFQDEAENLKEIGTWKQFEIYSRGRMIKKNCDKVPITCALLQGFNAAASCSRGQVKFSVMHPGTHVWPHCGPTNCRLRAHLGLKVPPGTSIRVADDTRSWQEGKIFVFDDSFEHEVWHNGTETRLVLIIDVWHPELTQAERRSLSPI